MPRSPAAWPMPPGALPSERRNQGPLACAALSDTIVRTLCGGTPLVQQVRPADADGSAAGRGREITEERDSMRTFHRITMLVALAGAAPAIAQDSVSRNANGGNGQPGDALSPLTTNFQKLSYVVDLTPFSSAWGTPLGVAPLVKSSRPSTNRFTAINGASTISQSVRVDAAFPSATYTAWTQPGGGINIVENNTALNTTISPAGGCSVFGVAVMDYEDILAGTVPTFFNSVVGALAAYDPAQPTRLYVTRTVGAINMPGVTGTDRSQFGLGSIDADGNLLFRADGFGTTGPTTTILQGDNYFRVRLPARTNSLNSIDNAGASQATATDWLLVRSTVTHATPTGMPADLAGRSVLIGADFVGNDRFESSPGVLTTTASHRPGTIDQRGGFSFSARSLFAGSIGTGASLTRSTGGGGKVDSISLWGVDSSGN